MNESKKLFVNQLLTADPTSLEARQRYEKEMGAMFEKTLTRGERRGYFITAILMGLLGLGVAVICGLNVLIEWPSRAMQAREDIKFVLAFFLLTGIVLLVVAAISFRAYWKGIVSRRTSNDWAAGAGVAYVGVLGCLFLLMARYIPEMLQAEARLLGLVLLMFAGVAWVRHCVTRAEMRTAEKLLEIELRLAEIGEVLEARSRYADPAIAQPPPPV